MEKKQYDLRCPHCNKPITATPSREHTPTGTYFISCPKCENKVTFSFDAKVDDIIAIVVQSVRSR